MKTTLLMAVGFAFTLNLSAIEPSGSSSGGGKSSEGGKTCPRHEGMKAEMLKKFDKNGDGKLDDTEKAAAQQAFETRKAEMLKKFDKNGDGQLDDSEKAVAKQAFETRKAEMLKKFDKNGDGQLDDSEKTAAKAAFLAQHKGEGDKTGSPSGNSPQK